MKRFMRGLIVLVTMLALAVPLHAADLGMGGGYSHGHSGNDSYSVDHGWSGYFSAETERHSGFTFGMWYQHIEMKMTKNSTLEKGVSEICLHDATRVVWDDRPVKNPCYEVTTTTGKPLNRYTVELDRLTAMLRFYPVSKEGSSLWRSIQPFVGAHAGYEFASDQSEPIVGGQAGLNILLTDSLSLEGSYIYWVREDRNYQDWLAGVKFTF